ncbi:MAG: hypothetical protein GX221_04625 [Candidatus Riflebacteria bacterium]|nr:hypothetical protein [Candidatus Riflebacteria bacterium]
MSLTIPTTIGGPAKSEHSLSAEAPRIRRMKESEPGELPKCFGTDYFGKWNTIGMTYEGMRIDRPEWQEKCGGCEYFDKCFSCNLIRLMRIKK